MSRSEVSELSSVQENGYDPTAHHPWRNRHFFLLDQLLIVVAVWISFCLRLETVWPAVYFYQIALFAGIAVGVTTALFRLAGLYSHYWRYASASELLRLVYAISLSTLVSTLLLYLTTAGLGILRAPLSVPPIYFLAVTPLLAVPRFGMRFIGRKKRLSPLKGMRPVLIVGAGDAGALMVRELQNNPRSGMEPVAFVDDDPLKQGMHIHGVPVAGNRTEMARVIARYQIGQVVIAMPTAPGVLIREIVQQCEAVGVPVKIMPGLYAILDGSVSVNQLRNVEIEDLLRREPVETDRAAIHNLLRGRRVLITGGGGSIGSELCRQIWRCEPAELIIVGHGENSVFGIQEELAHSAEFRSTPTSPRVHAIIADIRFPERISRIFAQYKPEIVFHAAAHKHVPLMEGNPPEAVTNNILGTRNLVNAALAHDVERLVMISTDKAVNPTNVMGASKRVAEMIVLQAARRHGLPWGAVRFGNVLGSRGSVVLTFRQQIAAGGPVTVTDPEMRRFFMTIPEAVQLVLQAAVLGSGGEIFVLDMGKPVRIMDLARDLIELSGLEPERDIAIQITGLRPGEKLFEELFVEGEAYERTGHAKIFVARNASERITSAETLTAGLAALTLAAEQNDAEGVVSHLQTVVPEYRPNRQKTALLPA